LDTIAVSYPLAFLAGLVSFLSPCVLPVVPGYLTFVSGLSLEELESGGVSGARKTAILHSVLFGIGFGAVFMTLGAAASAFGQSVARALPLLTRAGGVLVIIFGLYLLGVLRIGPLSRERRITVGRKPAGAVGSILVGIAFGAGWSPCIGPILGTILLYASLEATVVQGTLLLAVYAVGLGIPFLLAAVGTSWFLASAARLRNRVRPIQGIAGALLVAMGVLMASGHFAVLTRFLAGMGQLINLELE
jgi:cytochrome c-type biogenesis protein